MASVKDFSVEEKLKSLVLLQKIDGKLGEIQILKGELPMEVKDLEDEIEGLHARQTRVEEEINGMQEFIEQKKEAIKEAEALIKKYEKQSDNVKNNREFEAINKEIEMAKKYNKPIIAVQPWGAERTSSIVKNAADVIVGWNAKSVANAVRNYAIYQSL